jgi:hypothetical protein
MTKNDKLDLIIVLFLVITVLILMNSFTRIIIIFLLIYLIIFRFLYRKKIIMNRKFLILSRILLYIYNRELFLIVICH